ncbi:aryl-alcohol oxidase-like protein [Marasmius fiardii PR-910]|nr:aryl-alcohol oxidase-like protein [Marasmius fiardii PR-910]
MLIHGGLTSVLALLVALPSSLVFGKLITNPKDLSSSEYDFVIVGGGTAGSVVAARLTENPKFRVCVIEAGDNDDGNIGLMIPFTAPNNLNNASIIWNYTTVPQRGLHNRVLHHERGRVLGGSSSINFMTWTRGPRNDFDRIADVTGDQGWGWDAILPYILKSETFTEPVDHHNTSGEFDPKFHGTTGPFSITLPGFPSDLDPRILGTTESDQFPFNIDMNAGNPLGIGYVQANTGGGQRSSVATAYMHPALLNRPNLDVLLRTQVTRLIANETGHDGRSDLRSVEFAQSSNGTRSVIRASKEVILAAGAINTPQILLLSGVGEKEDLMKLGLKQNVQSAGVGKNFQDHPLLPVQWFANSTTTLDNVVRNATLADELVEQWATTRTGQLVDVGSNLIGWYRIPDESPIIEQHGDPSAGGFSPHFELYPFNGFFSFSIPAPITNFFFSIVINICSPASRGTVSLASNDPFKFPNIDPGYLTHPQDVAVAVEAVRVARNFTSQPSWSQYLLGLFGPPEIPSEGDSELMEYARNHVTTFWHPCCTTKMGKKNDSTAVVDADLLLKGATGLRIVDASVFPFIPAAHLQAPVVAIAERAADLIKSTWIKS